MTYMTARQNVQTALEISNKSVDNAKIEELFELVGIPKGMIDSQFSNFLEVNSNVLLSYAP